MDDVNILNILNYKMFKDICHIFFLNVKKITSVHNFLYIKRMEVLLYFQWQFL